MLSEILALFKNGFENYHIMIGHLRLITKYCYNNNYLSVIINKSGKAIICSIHYNNMY